MPQSTHVPDVITRWARLRMPPRRRDCRRTSLSLSTKSFATVTFVRCHAAESALVPLFPPSSRRLLWAHQRFEPHPILRVTHAATTLKRRLIKALVPSKEVPVQMCLHVVAALNPCTTRPNNFRQNKSGIKVRFAPGTILLIHPSCTPQSRVVGIFSTRLLLRDSLPLEPH